MSPLVRAVSETATAMGLVPLFWILLLHWRGHDPGAAWWWLALAFAVSWIADTAASWVNPWLVSPLYLVSQAMVIGFVFRTRIEALFLTAMAGAVAILAVAWRGVEGPDVLLHTVVWLAIGGIIYPLWQLGRLRGSLLVYFGLGLLAWWGYATWPGWIWWSEYQMTRVFGIALFCAAATSPLPHLKIISDKRSPGPRPLR